MSVLGANLFAAGVLMVEPVLPVWLMLLLTALVLGLAALVCIGYDLPAPRRWGLWLLRAGSMGILVWLLLLPELRETTVERELPVLAVAVDTSASMTDKFGDNRSSRGDRVREFLGERTTRAWLEKFRVVRFEIGDDCVESRADAGALEFAGARSFLTPAVNQVAARLQGQTVSGIVLLSDGLDQSGDLLSALGRSVPIYALELEQPSTVAPQEQKPDYYIAEVAAPKRTVVQWQTKVEALVRRRGAGVANVPVKLLEGDRELRTTTLAFAEGDSYQHAVFEITPTTVGQTLYRVELEPPAGDPVAENNFREFVIDVNDPENRVLYLEGSPRWEFKFLKRALIADKNFLLAAFVSTGPGAFLAFNESAGMSKGDLPKFDREGLNPYKTIILGDLAADALRADDYKGLQEFVDKGGGLLLSGGPKALGTGGWASVPQMKEMLPAQPQPGSKMQEGEFAVSLTAAGRVHPAMQGLVAERGFPPMLSYWSPVQLGDLSTALLSTTGEVPVLVVRRFGQGKVAMLLTDSLWRWQMGSADTGAGKNLYNQFMTQLVYWLAPDLKQSDSNAILQVFTADSEVDVRKQTVIGAALEGGGKSREATLTCRIETPDQQKLTFPMAPGMLGTNVGLPTPLKGYLVDFAPPVPGRYRITVASADGVHSADTILLARQAFREKTGAPASRDYLEGLSVASGGQYVLWKDRGTFFQKLPREVRERQIIAQRLLWPHWYWLAALVACFGLEWWWKRKLDLE